MFLSDVRIKCGGVGPAKTRASPDVLYRSEGIVRKGFSGKARRLGFLFLDSPPPNWFIPIDAIDGDPLTQSGTISEAWPLIAIASSYLGTG